MMLPGYGDLQQMSTLAICASSFLPNAILGGVLLYFSSYKKDVWLESRIEELNEIAHRNYNEHIKIDVKCPACGVRHTRLPLFANHTENSFFFKCENQRCQNVIYVSSLDPNTQIIASTLSKRV